MGFFSYDLSDREVWPAGAGAQAAAITEFDTPELHKLVEDMFESMYAAEGVGLAAPQIGIGKRIAVIDTTVGEDPAQKIVLINPEIIGEGRVADRRRGLPEYPDVSRDR